jgi:glycine/D-amino acid oxidase-like deaminating enzyme
MNLPDRAQIVVIGGGIIGCSTAYHLARDHKADVLLLEQGQLTSGSTWHAAGLVGQLRSSASITQVLKYSVDLYKRLAAETGLETGWKMTGCLRLATAPDRWTEFRRLATTARSFGMEMHLIPPDEVKRMWPLMDTSDLIGASWLPTDGQASPSDIARSLAKGARMHGATLLEGVRVTGFRMEGDRIVAVETTQGEVLCEKVVNCAGQWARQVGRMAGIEVPLQPIKHQYIITEPLPGLSTDAPTIRDPDRRTYFKEEVGGLVMGGYEPDPQPWTTGDVPSDWEFRLFDDDWDHFAQHMEQAITRVPALAEAGVKQMINGPRKLHPRRQLHPRPRGGMREHVRGRGLQRLRHRLGRRGGLGAGGVGDRGRGADGPLGRRHPPLLGPPRRPPVGLRPDLRGLRQALHRRLPARGDGKRPPLHRLPALRTAQGAPRSLRVQAWLGAPELVRARRRGAARPSIRWAARTGSVRWARNTRSSEVPWASSTNPPSPSTR